MAQLMRNMVPCGVATTARAAEWEGMGTVADSLACPLRHHEAVVEVKVMCVCCCRRAWLYNGTRC